MKIKIGTKTFEKNSLEFLDSINFLPSKEWIFYAETLYIALSGEFVLESTWQLNRMRYEDQLKDGVMKEEDFEPHTEYKILTDKEAAEWQEAAVWEI